MTVTHRDADSGNHDTRLRADSEYSHQPLAWDSAFSGRVVALIKARLGLMMAQLVLFLSMC
jgi:hypothetical protein